MGFWAGMLGNAGPVDPSTIQGELARLLAPGETVEQAYRLIRDYWVFTDKRLVLVNKQGLRGRKIDYHAIPYKSITHFSVETAGSFDLNAELKIWISGTPLPIQRRFTRQLNIYDVQAVLASHVLG